MRKQNNCYKVELTEEDIKQSKKGAQSTRIDLDNTDIDQVEAVNEKTKQLLKYCIELTEQYLIV